jgi:hypothetical protein
MRALRTMPSDSARSPGWPLTRGELGDRDLRTDACGGLAYIGKPGILHAAPPALVPATEIVPRSALASVVRASGLDRSGLSPDVDRA